MHCAMASVRQAFVPGLAAGCDCGCAARGAHLCPCEQGRCSLGAVCRGRSSASCQGQHSAMRMKGTDPEVFAKHICVCLAIT